MELCRLRHGNVMHACICKLNLEECGWRVCEHAENVIITMQIGCLRGCVHGTCVTLAEVNECEATMTE